MAKDLEKVSKLMRNILYLCYYLDYSDGRSDPIKRKLYPFEDEKLGLNHFKNLVSENIKKGWEKHGA